MIDEPTTTPAAYTAPSEDKTRIYHNPIVAVVIPLAQASISGAVLGLAGGLWAGLLDYARPVMFGFTTAATVQAGAWLLLLGRWANITRLERALSMDLNHDGYIGDPDPAPQPLAPIRIEINDRPNNRTVYGELPTTPDKLAALAQGLLSGASFSEGQWTGGGALFSRAEFRELRAVMLRCGIIAPASDKDARQGYALTTPGRAAMRHFATLAGGKMPQGLAPSPTLGKDAP